MLHISIDDTRKLFQELILKKPESIFMTNTAACLLEMHKRYGTSFFLYCTYRHREYQLSQVSDFYKAEFLANNWLNFGFHTYDEHLEYTAENDALLGEHYAATALELQRITGKEPYNRIIRIHRFQGGEQGCRALKAHGVQALLTADDGRSSYYLSETDEKRLRQTGYFEDTAYGMKFYPTLPRIENTPDILELVKTKAEAGWKIISVFTHERLLSVPDVAQRLDRLCKWDERTNSSPNVWVNGRISL